MPAPHPSAKLWTPDEVAEALDGISRDTGIRLWELLSEIPPKDQKPIGGYEDVDMGGDGGESGIRYSEYPPEIGTYDKGTVAAVWNKLTEEQQVEINEAFAAQERYYDELLSS